MDKRIKEEFQKDFDSINKKVNLSFDVNKLEPNTKVIKNKSHFKWIPISLGLAFAAVAAVVLPISYTTFSQKNVSGSKANKKSDDENKRDTVELTKKQYTQNQIKIIESNTFKKLNNVTSPFYDSPLKSQISEEEEQGFANFTNSTYQSLLKTSKKDNMSYCSIGLYSILNELEAASSQDDVTLKFNNLLGLNREERISFYEKVLKANNYARENSTTQLKNAAFFNNKFDYNQTYIDILTKLYCEAFQLNVKNDIDVNKVVKWVNDAVNNENFIDKDFLDIKDDTQILLFSTLYFENAWYNKYLEANNILDNFYLSNGTSVQTKFMKHSYQIHEYYDYDKYISFKDYYEVGGSVTYIVPKNHEDDIYELTKGINIFEENKENIVVASSDESSRNVINVELETPKFNFEAKLDFKDCLVDLGFGDIFDKNGNWFLNAFDKNKTSPERTWLDKIKQKNKIEFNETGSIIKSVTMTDIQGPTSTGPQWIDTLSVKLNQPFIYIIRDKNETPIFVGHVDNPTLAS